MCNTGKISVDCWPVSAWIISDNLHLICLLWHTHRVIFGRQRRRTLLVSWTNASGKLQHLMVFWSSGMNISGLLHLAWWWDLNYQLQDVLLVSCVTSSPEFVVNLPVMLRLVSGLTYSVSAFFYIWQHTTAYYIPFAAILYWLNVQCACM